MASFYIRMFLLSAPRFFAITAAFICTPYFVYIYSDDYAVFISLVAVSSFGSVVGQSYAGVRLRYESEYYFVSILQDFYILSSVVIFGVAAILYIFNMPFSEMQLAIVLLAGVLTGLCVFSRNLMVYHGRTIVSSAAESFFVITRYATLWAVAASKSSIDIFLSAFAVFLFLEVICYFHLRLRYFNDVASSIVRSGLFFKFCHLFLKNLLFQSVEYIFGNIDRILLSSMGGAKSLINYNFASSLASANYVVPAQINMHSFAEVFKIANMKEHVLATIRKLAVLFLLSLATYLLIGQIFIDFWLKGILSGSEQVEVFGCGLILIIAYSFNILAGPINNTLLATDRQIASVKVSLVVLPSFFFLMFVDHIDAVTVASVVLFVYFFRLIALLVVFSKVIRDTNKKRSLDAIS